MSELLQQHRGLGSAVPVSGKVPEALQVVHDTILDGEWAAANKLSTQGGPGVGSEFRAWSLLSHPRVRVPT